MNRSGMMDRFAPAIFIVLLALVFGMGVLWQKVNDLEKNGATVAGTTTTGTTADTTGTTPQAPTVSLDQIKDIFSNKNVIKFGDANRKVLFVEIADPSCPYCHIAAGKNPELNKQVGNFKLVADGGTYVAPVEEMKKLLDQNKASFAYIYSPGHGNGELGTKAMYCAHEKGKFWQVHDLLMNSAGYDLLNNVVKNDKAQSQKLADFLKSAVDPAFLKSCLESGKYDNRIAEDTDLARSLGVGGTPGFFVNATNFAGAYSYKDMESVVNQSL